MSQRLKADLLLIFCTVIWGATFVLVKDALSDASVFAFLLVRFALAALVLALVSPGSLARLRRRELSAGALIGCFMFAGYALQTVGLNRTTPSKAAFITGSSVIMVPLVQAALGRGRMNRWVWAGALAALAGLYFLTVPPAGLAALNQGDLWVLAAALMFAFHILSVGRFAPHHSVSNLTFIQIATTALLAALALPLLHATGVEPARLAWTRLFVIAVLVTAVGSTAVAFSIQVWAQRYTSPAHTAIVFSLEPLFAVLTSYIFWGERLGPRGLAGGALIFAGILLAELKGPAPAAAESSVPTAEAAAPDEPMPDEPAPRR
jgi:drug/metabolite transporter (DMT)-like permease